MRLGCQSLDYLALNRNLDRLPYETDPHDNCKSETKQCFWLNKVKVIRVDLIVFL